MIKNPMTLASGLSGRWISSGHLADDPTVEIRGTDTYVLLPGGRCLVHYVDVLVGSSPVQAIELITPGEQGTLDARAYDNLGEETTMIVQATADRSWAFTGGAEVAAVARPDGAAEDGLVRSVLSVDDDAMRAHWERSDDGARWQSWMIMDFALADRIRERDAFDAAPWVDGPSPDAATGLRQLAPLAGRWRWSGRSVTSDFRVEGETQLRWLAGGHVLVERGALTSAGQTNDSLAVTRWDPIERACVSVYVDSDGTLGRYRTELTDGRLSIRWPTFRYSATIDDTAEAITGVWERRSADDGWMYWYDAELRRIRPAP